MKGKKRLIIGTIAILVLTLFVTLTTANHSVTIAVAPLQIYETTSAEFVIAVANDMGSSYSINNVYFDIPVFTVLSAYTPTDWSSVVSANTVDYSTTKAAISSWATQNLMLELEAGQVNENTTSNWTINTTDYNNDTNIIVIQIIIVDDTTPPNLSNWLPVDGMYVKEGTDNQDTHITAVDPETGVEAVYFNYIDCIQIGTPEQSNETNSIQLSAAGDYYSELSNLSMYPDSTEVCFSFNAKNNGGAMSNVTGELTIDGFAPTVVLNSPSDGALMNSLSQFEFTASDNLAPTLNCDLLVDGVVEAQVIADNGVLTVVPVANISEGEHTWQVSCTDLAGWTTNSEVRDYILDRTPPTITVTSPLILIIAAGTPITIEVTDNRLLASTETNATPATGASVFYDLQQVIGANITTITISDTALWKELNNPYIITVNATDAAGNSVEEDFPVFIDETKPIVNLVSPLNDSNNTYDVNLDFTFNASDNNDNVYPLLSCSLYINGVLNGVVMNANTSSMPEVFGRQLMPGNYSWQVRCADNANNIGVSEIWNVEVVDKTGPTMTFNNADGTLTIRSNPVLIDLDILDISGVNAATVVADVADPNGVVTQVTLSANGDTYTGQYDTTVDSPIGDYTVTVTAEDNAGNANITTAIYPVTYSYVVDVDSLAGVETGAIVTVNGNVLFDNGSLILEDTITLELPETTLGVSVDNSTGDFTFVFNAPSSAGAYDVRAVITANNGLTFDDSETFSVTAPTVNPPSDPPGPGGNGGNGGPSGPLYQACGDNTRDAGEECDDGNTDDGDGCDSLCNLESYCGDGSVDSGENCLTCSADAGCSDGTYCTSDGKCEKNDKKNNKEKECTRTSECGQGEECNNGLCVGQGNLNPSRSVGSASGFLNFVKGNFNIMLLLLLLSLAVMFILAYLSRKDKEEPDDNFGLDAYLEGRDKN